MTRSTIVCERFWFWLLLVLSLFSKKSLSLKVWPDGLESSSKIITDQISQFSPSNFNVTRPLRMMEPIDGCNITSIIQQLLITHSITSSSDENYAKVLKSYFNNSVVLIIRGYCLFYEKVKNAQILGASGAIVGDNDPQNSQLLIMGSNEITNTTLEIPSVFITNSDYIYLRSLISSTSTSTISSNQNQKNGVSIVYVSLFESYDWGPNKFDFVPVVLMMMICISFFLRICIRQTRLQRNRLRRKKQLRSLRTIDYYVEGHDPGCHRSCIACQQPTENEGCNTEPENENEKFTIESYDKNHIGSPAIELPVIKATDSKQYMPLNEDPDSTRSDPDHLDGNRPINSECSICLEDFKCGDKLTLLTCKHGFHTACINPWISESSDLCPVCKQSIFTT